MSAAEQTEPPEAEAEAEAERLERLELEAEERRWAFDDLDLDGTIEWEFVP